MWRVTLLVLPLACSEVPEPDKEHYLFLRCRLENQCDASLRYMSEVLDCKLIAGGKDLDGTITRTYQCEKK